MGTTLDCMAQMQSNPSLNMLSAADIAFSICEDAYALMKLVQQQYPTISSTKEFVALKVNHQMLSDKIKGERQQALPTH